MWQACAMRWMMVAAAAIGVARAEDCPAAVTVTGPADAVSDLRTGLTKEGVTLGGATGCPSAQVVVARDRAGLTVFVDVPGGLRDTRTGLAPALAAWWVASMVAGQRLADLLSVPVEPEAEAAPAPRWSPPEEADGVIRLYRRFEDWHRGTPTAEITGTLTTRDLRPAKRKDEVVFEPYYAIDQPGRAAREVGRVWGFEIGGEVYVNDRAPRPGRAEPYGRMDRVGDTGVYQRFDCSRVPNGSGGTSRVCWTTIRSVDLDTGRTTTVKGRGLFRELASDPALHAAFEAARPWHPGVVREYLLRWLERRAADAGGG